MRQSGGNIMMSNLTKEDLEKFIVYFLSLPKKEQFEDIKTWWDIVYSNWENKKENNE